MCRDGSRLGQAAEATPRSLLAPRRRGAALDAGLPRGRGSSIVRPGGSGTAVFIVLSRGTAPVPLGRRALAAAGRAIAAAPVPRPRTARRPRARVGAAPAPAPAITAVAASVPRARPGPRARTRARAASAPPPVGVVPLVATAITSEMADLTTGVATTARPHRATRSSPRIDPSTARGLPAVSGPVTLTTTGEAATFTAVGRLNGNASSIKLDSIHTTDGIIGISRIVVLNESVAALHIQTNNAAVLAESVIEIALPCA